MEPKTPQQRAPGRLSISRIGWIGTALVVSLIFSGLVFFYFPIQFERLLLASLEGGAGENPAEISAHLDEFRISNAWLSLLIFIILTGVAWISSIFLRTSSAREHETLEAVGAGRFFLDDRLEIREPVVPLFSGFLEPSGLFQGSFVSFLKSVCGEEIYVPAEFFLSKLLNPAISEAELAENNPLECVELKSGDGREKRVFRFEFKRDFRKNRIRGLRVIVRDVTDVTRLNRELEQAEDKANQQYQLLTAIVQIEPTLLEDFFRGCVRELETIKNTLSSDIGIENFREKLYVVYRALHTIKGNASLLKLNLVREQAHAFEERINEVKSTETYQPSLFQSLNTPLEDLHASLSLLRYVREFLASTNEDAGEKGTESDRILMASIENFISRLAGELGKQVGFDHHEFNGTQIPEKYRRVFKDVLIQLIRNSLRHGIEPSEEREKLGKPAEGKLLLKSFQNGPQRFSFSFRDDGRGLQAERLISAALASGRWSRETIEGWDEQKLFAVIFEPGFSTAKKASMNAGWGVGMDIVKKRIEQYGGEVKIFSEPLSYCEFRITLPV